MLASQSTDNILSSISLSSIVGIFLGSISGILGAFFAHGTLIYGEELFKSCFKRNPPKELLSNNLNNVNDIKALVLFTFSGLAISSGVASILSTGLGFWLAAMDGVINVSQEITITTIVGAMSVGIAATTAAMLLRYANVIASKPGVNALYFMSPGLALLWLSLAGINIPRIDLFLVGASLILTINVLLQLKPDAERDLERFSKGTVPGVRLGFTAFIMSIWTFGTIIYLRDEIMPNSWLQYSTDEYWGLVALSATVFALILGFRIARLSARINKEDETMLDLFRDSEYLVGKQILCPVILKNLEGLDTVKPKELLKIYSGIRKEVRSGKAEAQSNEDKALLLSVEKQLDEITHSKQQGRDIVELLSLTAFAVVTVGLGLLIRPKGLKLNLHQASWSGFLSEVFILLFGSTIAFLCINLFDIRRERETPLIVSVEVEEENDDYQLFFRHKQNLKWQHFTAVVISIVMSITFSVLLYKKWM